jgi:hypothetical protein
MTYVNGQQWLNTSVNLKLSQFNVPVPALV